MPKESALATKMELLALGLEDKHTSLHQAWTELRAKGLIDLRDDKEKIIARIGTKLLEFEKQPYVENAYKQVPVANVMRFLREDGPEGGLRFVGNDEEGNSLRPRWIVFRNAYAAWFLERSQSGVQQYLQRAAKQNTANTDVYQPSWVSPKSTIPNILHWLLASQLVMVREPVLLSEADLQTKGIERVIADSFTDE